MASLNATQRRLKNELDEIAEIVGVDYWNIRNYEREAWTPKLQVMKRQLVRGEVVTQYTLIDDLLSTELCRYFFPGKTIFKQWKTKRFRRFNYYVIERLYMTQKLAFLKDVFNVPREIASKIEEINALRNALAHAFFPENLRAYQIRGRPAPRKEIVVRYRGHDIFTVGGARAFAEDCGQVTEYLVLKLKRKKNARPLGVPVPMVAQP